MTAPLDPELWIRRPAGRAERKTEPPGHGLRLRLFCFPHAGGGASAFRSWAARLPAGVDLCPVQLPGRENRLGETPFTGLAPLVRTLAQVLAPYLELPFAIFGHSMGALVGFELAQQVRREYGRDPVHLWVAAGAAPALVPAHPPIHHLPDGAFIAELRRLEGTPEEVFQHPELLDLLLPALRADFTVYETYTYQADRPLDCPISAFGGTRDLRTGRDALGAWRDETTGPFQLRMFPGDHFFLQRDPGPLLEAVNQDLGGCLVL